MPDHGQPLFSHSEVAGRGGWLLSRLKSQTHFALLRLTIILKWTGTQSWWSVSHFWRLTEHVTVEAGWYVSLIHSLVWCYFALNWSCQPQKGWVSLRHSWAILFSLLKLLSLVDRIKSLLWSASEHGERYPGLSYKGLHRVHSCSKVSQLLKSRVSACLP